MYRVRFSNRGIICGRYGIHQGYKTGRSTIVLRARARVETVKNKSRIVISEIPFQQFRDRVIERIAALAREEKIKGIAGIRDESDLKEPVRIVVDIKNNADPEIVAESALPVFIIARYVLDHLPGAGRWQAA